MIDRGQVTEHHGSEAPDTRCVRSKHQPLEPPMSTVTRNEFTQRFDGKSVSLSSLNGLSNAQRTALRRADANGDGRLEGSAELRAAFNQIDNFDRNGSRTSVNAGTSARPSTAGAMIRSMEQAATAAPRRGLSGNTQPTEAAPRATSGADGTAQIERTTNAGRRNQMVSGTITVNGRSYDFRSGGFGRGSLPKGEYTVTRHLDSRSDRSMSVGGVGYSFAVSDKFDSRVGATRTLLRIHPDGGSAGTEGCIGIVGNAATQRQFRADMLAELRRNGGRYTLNVQ
jgi:hypothetical protein